MSDLVASSTLGICLICNKKKMLQAQMYSRGCLLEEQKHGNNLNIQEWKENT